MTLSRRSFIKLSGATLAGLLFPWRPASSAGQPIRGLYLPAGKLKDPDAVRAFEDTVLQSGANAVVVDIKDEAGLVHLPFEHPFKPIGNPTYTYPDQIAALLDWCRAQGVRPVARQVVFQDGWLASAHPDHALLAGSYSDPFSDKVHDYNAAVAEAAARQGFEEVQFDYIRFPTDRLSEMVWRQPWTFENRTSAIARFLATTAPRVRAAGARVSADVFGITAWVAQKDAGIGQYLELMAPHLDSLCPMAYPSTYGTGIPDCPDKCKPAPSHPFEIVFHTTRLTLSRARIVAPKITVTPWLQAFGDYLFSLPFGPPQYWDQQRGALAAGADGFYCWNATGRYPADVFLPQEKKEAVRTRPARRRRVVGFDVR